MKKNHFSFLMMGFQEASAFVASAHLWIGFPLTEWKMKAPSGEALSLCDLWLALQRFFQWSLSVRRENPVRSSRSWGLEAKTDERLSEIYRKISLFLSGLIYSLKPPLNPWGKKIRPMWRVRPFFSIYIGWIVSLQPWIKWNSKGGLIKFRTLCCSFYYSSFIHRTRFT